VQEVGLSTGDIAQNQVEVKGRLDQGLSDQVVRIVDHARVESLELGLDATIGHFLSQTHDQGWFIDTGLGIEIERTERQAGHIRLEIASQRKDIRAFLIFAEVSATGRDTNHQVWCKIANPGNDFGIDLLAPVRQTGDAVPGMQMNHRNAQLMRFPDILDDLTGTDRHMRGLTLGRNHAGRCEIDNQFIHGQTSFG